MTRPPAPHPEDPASTAPIRRHLIAATALTAAAHAAILLCYLRGVDQLARVGVVLILVLTAFGIEHALRRRLRRRRGTLSHPFDLTDRLITALAFAAFLISIPAEPHYPVPAWSAMIAGPALAAGIAAIVHAFRATAPAPPACPDCQYELTGLKLPSPCPECARPLTQADADTPRFARVRRPRLAWTGAVLIAFASLWLFLFINATDRVYKALPGPLHRHLAATERPALEALDTDALSSTQRVALAERITNAMRTHDQWMMSDQVAWISEQIAAGRLPPETVDRFAVGNFNLRIIHRPARRNALIEFACTAEPPLTDQTFITQHYFFPGFTFNDSPPVGGDGHARVTLSLEGGWPFVDAYRAYNAPFYVRPAATYLPSPGPLTVRARIVTVLTRGPNTPTIMWTADDQYILTGDIIHTAELTAETTLRIDP